MATARDLPEIAKQLIGIVSDALLYAHNLDIGQWL
jgi:hypothetical protein